LTIALFTSIHNIITASVGLAVGSAGIRDNIVILSAIVTFLTNLNNTISTDRSGSWVIGRQANSSGGCNNWVSSIQSLKISVGGSWDDILESSALSNSQSSWLLNNKPPDILGARWSSFRTHVREGTNNRGQQEVQVHRHTGEGLSASVQGANWRATTEGSVGVQGSIIAFLSLVSLSDTITTESSGAGRCASGGSIHTGITFFIRVNNTITTEMSSAVQSASVSKGVGVGSTIIAIFSSLLDSIATILSAAGTSIIINVVLIITLLTIINNTITTPGILAVHTASIWLAVTSVVSSITLFAAKGINNIITTLEQLAVHTAGIWSGVTVAIINSCREFARVSIIALLSSIVDDTISTLVGAVFEATSSLNNVITIFIQISDAITTGSRAAKPERMAPVTAQRGSSVVGRGI